MSTRETILRAITSLGHVIEDESATFHLNVNKPGEGVLSQMVDAIESALAQSNTMSTIEALKGVIRELLAAKAELELAGLHFAVERAEAALAAAAPSQKPFAYFVYIAAEQRGEFVHDLDEAIEDLTNCDCEVTELFDRPAAAPTPDERIAIRDAAYQQGVDAMALQLREILDGRPVGFGSIPPELDEVAKRLASTGPAADDDVIVLLNHIEDVVGTDFDKIDASLWNKVSTRYPAPMLNGLTEAEPSTEAALLRIRRIATAAPGMTEGQVGASMAEIDRQAASALATIGGVPVDTSSTEYRRLNVVQRAASETAETASVAGLTAKRYVEIERPGSAPLIVEAQGEVPAETASVAGLTEPWTDPLRDRYVQAVERVEGEVPAGPSAEYLPQTWVTAVAKECGLEADRLSCLFDFAERVQRAARLATPAARDAGLSDGWYLQDTRTFVGNDVMWWAKNRNGYTTDISKAHVFTRDEAFRQAAMRGCDRAWPKVYIDGKTRPAVDFQYIDHDEAMAAAQEKTGERNG